MKRHFFHLMPYKHLPQDFAERYPSVWVDVPSQLYDPVKGFALYNEYLDELEHADQAGFDGLCVNEHHSNAYSLMPSPNLMLAALARRTRRAALVVLGNSLALYNPPIRVASDGLIRTAYAEAFHAAIPGSHVAILNGAGHLPMLEQREAFADAVRGFLVR